MYIFTYILWYLYHSWQTAPNPRPHPFFWKHDLYCLSPFSNFVSPCLLTQFCLQPPTPMLFLLPCFFDWMGDRATFDVICCYDVTLFNVMILRYLMLWWFSYYHLKTDPNHETHHKWWCTLWSFTVLKKSIFWFK